MRIIRRKGVTEKNPHFWSVFSRNKWKATDSKRQLYPKPGGPKTENGFSTQAPQGMVRITVQEMIAWLNSNQGKFS